MKRIISLILAAITAFAPGFLLNPHLAAQSQPPAVQQDISEFEKRLSQVREQIKDLKAKLEREGKKESGLLAALDKIGMSKNLVRKELAMVNLQREKTNRELLSLRSSTARLHEKLKEEERSIGKTLVTLYKFGRVDVFQFILQAEDIQTFFSESKHLALLAEYQKNVIAGYQQTAADLQADESRLEDKKIEIAGILRNADVKKQELEAEERKNRDLILEIQKSKKSYEQTLEELNESAKQLQILIKKIISQEFVFPGPFVPLYEKNGKLPWPLEGKIVTPFGLERHPQFNTITMNNGIEIAPQKNKTTIQAVHPGKVVYADFFQGYGNLIILDHGMTYYTLYGHCSEFLVNMGDMVQTNQPLALVGDSGSLKGETLYFELRFKTKALNPLQWLKRK